MATHGTDAYEDPAAGPDGFPPLVRDALALARAQGFPYSCRPEQGRLLRVLAGGATTRVAETGTGLGVGLAWLASGARAGVRLYSVERDPERARLAAGVFAERPEVTVLRGDWRRIEEHGPFDLLVLDGGGQGKAPGDPPADVERLLVPGGTVVVDDFTPATGRPPRHGGGVDLARVHWLEHPALRAVELRLAADLSVVVGTRPLPEEATGEGNGRPLRG
ncbi:O-methyltransferase [Streptomyces sp. NPDC090108]|uniref:O-methyltransferase n=1 Tax=Streptomyces sp. NPDC090108 TaxID=3365947 RepID=UPI00380909BF